MHFLMKEILKLQDKRNSLTQSQILLRGNPEGNNALGGVDPGFDKTKKILKLTTEDGDAVPIQICYEERQSCATTKSSKIFGGTKRYQEKLSVDVSAEGMWLAFML